MSDDFSEKVLLILLGALISVAGGGIGYLSKRLFEKSADFEKLRLSKETLAINEMLIKQGLVPEDLQALKRQFLLGTRQADGARRELPAPVVSQKLKGDPGGHAIPTITRIFFTVQQLESLCFRRPNDAARRIVLGRYLLFLGETQTAQQQFLVARKLKFEKRGIARGWIMLSSLALGDVERTRATLSEIAADNKFDYRDGEHYLAIYDAWCSSLAGSNRAWDALVAKYLSGNAPPTDVRYYPYVYFELAAGLIAAGQVAQALKAINLGDIKRLGALYMCGIAGMPTFDSLHNDRKYGPKTANWFDARARYFHLPSLDELRRIIEDWRSGRKVGDQSEL